MKPHSPQPDVEPFAIPSRPTETDRLLAGLSYATQILVPALLPVILLLNADTRRRGFLRAHAIHSLGLLAVGIVYLILAASLYILGSATLGCLVCLLWVLFFAPAGVLLYYGWKAFTGSQAHVPWLTDILRANDLL